jgi:hypothetical protein
VGRLKKNINFQSFLWILKVIIVIIVIDIKRRFKKIINFKNFLLDIKSHAISIMREESLIVTVLIRERERRVNFYRDLER